MTRVFVYGTLKEGFPNFHINRGTRLPGRYRTVERFPLFVVGAHSVPWMIDSPGQGHRVEGEVYDVSPAVLQAMDVLEQVGEPDGYRKVTVRVEAVPAASGTLDVFAYLKTAGQLEGQPVGAGPLEVYPPEQAALYRRRGAA